MWVYFLVGPLNIDMFQVEPIHHEDSLYDFTYAAE